MHRGRSPLNCRGKQEVPPALPDAGAHQEHSRTFEWKNKKLIFRTAKQQYHVDEFHILHRLEQSGFTGKSGPRKATVEAVWMVNRFDGLRILYMRTINLAKTKR